MRARIPIASGIWWSFVAVEVIVGVVALSGFAGPVTPLVAILAIGGIALAPLSALRPKGRSAPAQLGPLAEASLLGEGHLDQHGLELLFGREIVRARRYSRPFSILLGAISKEGSEPPDRELIDVVRFTQELVRSTDEVGPWSEGRVLIILSESTDEQARQLINRLGTHLRSRLPAAEVRFGVATHQADDSIRTMIARAERQL